MRTLNAIQCSLHKTYPKRYPNFHDIQTYINNTPMTVMTNAKYVADGVKSAVASDVALPQHSRLYVTLFARAATSKTEPLTGPWL